MSNEREDIFLRTKVWEYLLEKKIKELPINVFELAARNGYFIVTYESYARLMKREIPQIIFEYQKEGFVFWSKKMNRFIICFNEKYDSRVVNWTIMHEISHIILKHVTEGRNYLTRLRDYVDNSFERQANGFTRRFLCPSIVLHDCGALTKREIKALCGISKDDAANVSEYINILEERNKFRTTKLEREVEKQFLPFIQEYLGLKSGIDVEFVD